MKRFVSNTLFISFCLAGLLAPVGADVLVMTNGDQRKGLVEDAPGQSDKVVFTDAAGRATIDRSRIAKIVKEPQADGLIAIGNQMYEKGSPQEALDYYHKAKEADPASKKADDLIAATEQELNRKASDERRQTMLDISEKLRKARELYEAKKFAEAQKQLEQAAKMKPTETQAAEMKSIQIRMLTAWGQERLDRMDTEGAAEKFQAVLVLAPENTQAINSLIDLWRNDRTRTEQVRQLLEARLKANPNDNPTIKELADIAYREKQYERALPLYEKIYAESGAWVGTDVEKRLQELLQTLRDKAATAGNMTQAVAYQKELMKRFPETDPTLLDVYDYRARFAKIKPDDEKGWVSLAKWAEEKEKNDRLAGLFKPLDLYRKVLVINSQNPDALKAYQAAAREQLAQAKQEFQNGNYYLAKTLLDDIQKDFPLAPQVVVEAKEFSDMTTIELNRQRERSAEAAKQLLQKADYYYQQAQYNQSLLQLSNQQISEVPVVANPRHLAIQNYDLAIRSYQQVIALAPNLPDVASGLVAQKLQQAQIMIQRLRYPINFGLPQLRS